MTTGTTSNTNVTRDVIIDRALRIVHAIGDAETADSTTVTQVAITLGHVLAEWDTYGMPLWNMNNYVITPMVLSQAAYTISAGGSPSLTDIAPIKIIQGWMHDSSSNTDTPMIQITQQDYNMLGNKTSTGTPNQFWYKIPPAIQSSAESIGTVRIFPTPDANAVSYKTLYLVGQKPLYDFSSASTTLDFPPHYMNAVVWSLAAELSYEYALPFAERSMIDKKAMMHRDQALAFGTEEGYIQFRPGAQYG